VQLRGVPPGAAVESLRPAGDRDRLCKKKRLVPTDLGAIPQNGKERLMSANSGPGYKKYPDHRIATELAAERVRVTLEGQVIADTRHAIKLQESNFPAVYYIPRRDVKMERLVRTSHQSHCPFKGDAAYFSLKDGAENAVWTYEQPYDEVNVIKERLAFYPDKVQIAVEGEKAGVKR
jgi:uncharacterized protein (DUF427 family)